MTYPPVIDDPHPTPATLRIPKSFGTDRDLPATCMQDIEAGIATVSRAPNFDFPRIRGYEILATIGTGGMGIVYEARHRELNRRVAIKTLREEALAGKEFRTRFRSEAEAIAKLQHPNIIQVFEVGQVEASPGESAAPFIALEYVGGGSLAQRTRSPQPPEEAAKMVELLARAAHSAHRIGIVHRDLKPANVLLTHEGLPKIADFGIAKQIDDDRSSSRAQTRAGLVVGTPEYMAPEQLNGEPAAPANDIYSLGTILYELLTARVPFQGSAFAETMRLALSEEPLAPRQLQPSIPRDLETICLKCLEKQPSKRYASAEELAEDLLAWRERRPIRARSIGKVGRAVRWARRNPAITGLLAAVTVVFVVGVSGIVYQWRTAKQNENQARLNEQRALREVRNAAESADKERWERYRVGVFAASAALRLHDTNAARRALDDTPPEHRDWVWSLLNAQRDRASRVIKTERADIAAAEFFDRGRHCIYNRDNDVVPNVVNLSDGSLVPVGTDEYDGHGTVEAFGRPYFFARRGTDVLMTDVHDRKRTRTFRGLRSPYHQRRVDTERRRVTAFDDRDWIEWDFDSGEIIRRITIPKVPIPWIDICPAGRYLTTRSTKDGHVNPYVWQIGSDIPPYRLLGHEQGVHHSIVHNASDRIVTVEPFPVATARVYQLSTGRLLGVLRGHTNSIGWSQFSHTGDRLLTTSMDRSIRVWDLTSFGPTADTRSPILTLLGHVGWVRYATFNRKNDRIISTSIDRTVRYWNAKTGECMAVLCGHSEEVVSAIDQEDGKSIASVSHDGTIRLWDTDDVERNYAIRGHGKFVYSVAFHPDGRRLASSAWDGTARLWKIDGAEEIRRFQHFDDQIVPAVAIHPQGKYLGTMRRAGKVHLWDAETGMHVHEWDVPGFDWHDSRLRFSPDGRLLAAGNWDGSVRVYDVESKELVARLAGYASPIRDLAFSPDGTMLAVAQDAAEERIPVWDTRTWKVAFELTGTKHGHYCVAWNKDSTRLAVGGSQGFMRLFDVPTRKAIADLPQGSNAYGVAFTPDGRSLAVACADNLIRIWDTTHHQVLAELSGHQDYVHDVAFSPDGTQLVSASGDWSLRIWDTLTPVERRRRNQEIEAQEARLSASGSR